MNALNSISNFPPRPKPEFKDKPIYDRRAQLACRRRIELIQEAKSLGVSVKELTGEL